jgi:predicted PurR-regulated permease PerM
LPNPFRESVRVLGLYIRAQFLVAAIDVALYSVGFGLARVPLWPLWAIIGGFCSFIPSVGSLIPLILVTIADLVAQRSWTELAFAFGAWLAVQAIEGFVLQPILFSKPLGLRALPVFLALLLGSLAFGPIGLLLAVPVLAVANVFWRHFQQRKLS